MWSLGYLGYQGCGLVSGKMRSLGYLGYQGVWAGERKRWGPWGTWGTWGGETKGAGMCCLWGTWGTWGTRGCGLVSG